MRDAPPDIIAVILRERIPHAPLQIRPHGAHHRIAQQYPGIEQAKTPLAAPRPEINILADAYLINDKLQQVRIEIARVLHQEEIIVILPEAVPNIFDYMERPQRLPRVRKPDDVPERVRRLVLLRGRHEELDLVGEVGDRAVDRDRTVVDLIDGR